jgi:DNA-directed RNA polymerase subunit alpha
MMEYSIALPSKPRVVSEEEYAGTYEIDGLYPGYGHTLGNSLRRIILSSLPGAAITSVKIDGVEHEFSTMDGVREDVVTILLNLKKLRFEVLTSEAQTVTLSVKGPKKVSGADLTLPGQVRLLNPNSYICELTDNTKIEAEFRVERGLGYVPREALKKDRVEIGEISLDAAFSPIRRSNYEVENMRVGDRTDFNRLRLSIETDGTISPRTALEQSIEVMITQLKAVVGFREEEDLSMSQSAPVAEVASSNGNSLEASSEAMKTRIEDLDLSSRTVSALEKANIRTVGGLARKKEEDLLEIDGLGPKAIQEIKRALANFGIVLK